MAELNETPRGNRIHIAFFGLRNAGKSTLVNAFTGQQLAIVSDVAGTTTDPVSKAMEILPLGPCLITDTAGLDDVGELGQERVKKTLDVLATTDVAVWVSSGLVDDSKAHQTFEEECRARKVTVLNFHRGESAADLKQRIAALQLTETPPPLLDGLVKALDRVICVCPIDSSAPKGRLILPQQQVIRECLDLGAFCTVCQPDTLEAADPKTAALVVTDSQAFGAVRKTMLAVSPSTPLTSFSILFARQKGDLAEYEKGIAALKKLRAGDRVLIAEGCTHHRQCKDIGMVQIPKALAKLSGTSDLALTPTSGTSFPLTVPDGQPFNLVVQCGGCMLTRREVQRRIALCREAGVPIVNYGMVLATLNGIEVQPGSCIVKL